MLVAMLHGWGWTTLAAAGFIGLGFVSVVLTNYKLVTRSDQRIDYLMGEGKRLWKIRLEINNNLKLLDSANSKSLSDLERDIRCWIGDITRGEYILMDEYEVLHFLATANALTGDGSEPRLGA